MKQKFISELKMSDPRISRFDNILSKIFPKFLNLYRIYGTSSIFGAKNKETPDYHGINNNQTRCCVALATLTHNITIKNITII
jgi:hypothetical protein